MKSKLTNRERKFIDGYFVHFNASRAAREAGYAEDSAATAGYKVLLRPHIQEIIRKRLETDGVTADRIITNLAKIGFADGTGEDTEDKYSTGDILSALDKLAKARGLYKHNIHHTGQFTIDDLINEFDNSENTKDE